MGALPGKDRPYILGARADPPLYMKIVTTDGDVLTFDFQSKAQMDFVWNYVQKWIDKTYPPIQTQGVNNGK